jgi:hypothetical protein
MKRGCSKLTVLAIEPLPKPANPSSQRLLRAASFVQLYRIDTAGEKA